MKTIIRSFVSWVFIITTVSGVAQSPKASQRDSNRSESENIEPAKAEIDTALLAQRDDVVFSAMHNSNAEIRSHCLFRIRTLERPRQVKLLDRILADDVIMMPADEASRFSDGAPYKVRRQIEIQRTVCDLLNDGTRVIPRLLSRSEIDALKAKLDRMK